MKLLYTHLLLVWVSLALVSPAQAQPGGFGNKQKTAAPDAHLARRLNATETPLPARQQFFRSGLVANTAARSLPPLRLRVVRDPQSGLPISIENQVVGRSNPLARRSAAAATYQFLGQVRGLMGVADPEQSFRIDQTTTDDLGQTHHRLAQLHRGVPVFGAELTVHQANGTVTLVNGQYRKVGDLVDMTPDLSLEKVGKLALQAVGAPAPVRAFGQNLLKLEPVAGELCVFAGEVGSTTRPRLAYALTVRPNLLDSWQMVLDANTGAVLQKVYATCSIDGPRTATTRDLNGTLRTVNTYQSGTGHLMLDASRAMFDKTKSHLPDNPVGGIWAIDANFTNPANANFSQRQIQSAGNNSWTPTAVSAQYNGGLAYDYFLKTFKRNAINGKGGTVISIINVNEDDGTGMDNAFWNGECIFYGNGATAFKPLAGALDVAGHEMSHGVIQNTANLVYQGQSGAINESFADIFGVLIDRDDWTVGEDIVVRRFFPSGAMRSMANPNQGGPSDAGYQPKTMAQYVGTTEDNGGVHINSGIPNFAFYQIATAINKEKAEQIYYRALQTYLTRSSKFLDLRLAVIRAATDIHGASSAEVTAVRTAFDNVGIRESTTAPPDTKPPLPTATGQDFVALVSTSDSKLYSTPYPAISFVARSTSALKRRPSLTDDGSLAYFVGTDGRIRATSMTRPASETVISQEAGWANVAIAKDGRRLAALTDKQDGKVWVYSFELAKWQTFTLYNPTSANGVRTGEVRYADSFEWDYSGENIVYDAYNKLRNATGQSVDYWDVGLINVWDGATRNFAKGQIEKVFTDLDEGVSIGNPSFSKTAPDILAFDYFDESNDTYYVLSANIEKGDVGIVYENNDLGFPDFSRTDNALVFGTTTSAGKPGIGLMALEADKLTPKGTVSVPYTGGKWPVWFTNVSRALPARVNQTIAFAALPDQFLPASRLDLQATSSAGLPVGFSVRSGPAELTGNQLTITGEGTVVVRAFQEGNSQTFAAAPVDRSFRVLPPLGLEPAWANAVRLFPNPTRNRLRVDLPTGRVWQQVQVVAASGAVVQTQRNAALSGTLLLDLEALPAGLYILSIDTDSGRIQRKIVRE